MLLGFNDFSAKKIFEAVSESAEDFDFVLVADNDSDKKSLEKFTEDVKKIDSKKAEDTFNKIMNQGRSNLGNLAKAMQLRQKLDSGELQKVGRWYIGKGAWRINSNIADHLGLTPKWMTWADPMQDEILSKYYTEEGEESEEGGKVIPVDFNKDREREEELALVAEGLKYIKKSRLFEDEEFTLGPPSHIADEAVVVTPEELIEDLKANFRSRQRKNVMIWGAPGIGKTQIVKQAAKELSQELGLPIPVMVVTLSQMQPYDLNGIPLLFSKEESQATIADFQKKGLIQMDFAVPAWLPGEGDMELGVLFFDEINRAMPDMLSASLSLLLDRKAQKYEMPSGWRVWAAGNRTMDGPVTPFEGAVASRFLGGHIHLVPTIDSWTAWARSPQGYFKDIDGNSDEMWFVPDEFIAFLKGYDVDSTSSERGLDKFSDKPRTEFKYFYNYNKSKLNAGGEGTTVGYPVPRSWAAAFESIYDQVLYSKYLGDSTESDPRKKVISMFSVALKNQGDRKRILHILSKIVGVNAAEAFISFCEVLSHFTRDGVTLSEQITNIFTKPSDVRPFLGTTEKVAEDIKYAILTMVEGLSGSLVKGYDPQSLGNFANWMNWIADVADSGIVSQGRSTAHVSSMLQLHTASFIHITKPENADKYGKALQKFASVFKEPIAQFKRL